MDCYLNKQAQAVLFLNQYLMTDIQLKLRVTDQPTHRQATDCQAEVTDRPTHRQATDCQVEAGTYRCT